MTRPGILVATPAYGGLLYHSFFISVMRLEKLCAREGIEVHYQVVANESLIPRARNFLCQVFLDSGLSHMLFLDADIEFEAEDILRMYRAGVPLIGGVYPKKKVPTEYVVATLGEDPKDPEQPIPVRYVGTGMMLLRREVLEQMIEKGVPQYWAEGRTYHCFFDTRLYEGVYLSEDYDFCQRWRDMGGTVMAAFWPRVTHWGSYGYHA